MRELLVFDIAITGHHSEYIGHLIDYLLEREEKKDINYYFVVHPEFSLRFPEIVEKAQKIEFLTWIQIEPKEEKTVDGGLMKKSIASYRIMHRYAMKLQVDHVYSLDFHTIKYGSILFRTPYTLSAIQFVQFYRLDKATFQDKWVYYKRYYLTKLNVWNKKVVQVFVLNDEETANFLNREFKTNIFKVIPDPIPNHQPLAGFDIYRHYDIDGRKKIFLHIGSLGERKGSYEVIDAAQHFTDSAQEKIVILLVGKASTEVEKQTILRKMESNRALSKVQLIWDDRFVSTGEMKSLFNQCHCVLIPYKNAEYSSGILGHAAAAQRMVIATGAGLLKNIVLKYGLGLLVDRPTSEEIADKIEEALNYAHSTDLQKGFVEKHDPSAFAKILLGF